MQRLREAAQDVSGYVVVTTLNLEENEPESEKYPLTEDIELHVTFKT